MQALRPKALEMGADIDVVSIDRAAARAAPMSWHWPEAPATFYQRRGKRLLDLVLGTLLFVALLPLMAGLALAILLTSGRPVLYAAQRVGKDRRPFLVWKLRTMVCDADRLLECWKSTHPELAAEYERHFKLRHDGRVTALGHFLRKSSLDELPQLWNVIRGEMSLVGPRPIVATEVAKYGEHARELMSSRPGVTGRWQVNGRNHVTYPERKWVELTYCRSVTLAGDLRILLLTLAAPFRFNGV